MDRLVENKKVRLDYELLDNYECGIELFGYEVKSLRAKHGSLEGSHVIIRGSEAYLMGAFIPPYQEKNTPETYDPRRTRRLLLRKKEIAELERLPKGLTIVPVSLYNKSGKLKASICVARGKRKFDKRETLKKRTTERELRRDHKVR